MAKVTPAKLSPKHELFCRLYASDEEFFGNGLQAYAQAYGLDLTKKSHYGTARANASRLLTRADVLARINQLLDLWVSNEVADKELGFVIVQKAHLSAKVAAIHEYNKVKGRHAPVGVKFVDDNADLTDEELEREIARRLAQKSAHQKKTKSA